MINFPEWTALFATGGLTVLLLIFCALVCLIIIIERLIYFQIHALKVVQYVEQECRQTTELYFEETKNRAIAEKIPEMEKFLLIQATLGAISPYIGLLGTLLGVIRAFHGLGAEESASGINELNAGIAQALVATAAGLFVAIPATVSYNHFRKKVNEIVRQADIAASRLKAELFEKKKKE